MHISGSLRTSILLMLAGTALPCAAIHAQRVAPMQADRYGYQSYDSTTAQCPAQPIDVSGGTAFAFVAAGPDYPARDEGAAVVTLSAPFELFGVPLSALVASSNGYLAAADSVAAENGADFSGACPLPAIAGNGPAAQKRILVYHDDLSGETGNGTTRSMYFASCPRPGDAGLSEACTVIDWDNWGKPGTSGLSMQAVLYHRTWEIVLQYRSLDASAGATATVGVQDPANGWGAATRCGGALPIPAPGAICLFDPCYPAGSGDVVFKDGFEVMAR
jgi:hypothetical protein